MTQLVKSNHPSLLRVKKAVSLLKTCDDAFDGIVKVIHRDRCSATTGSKECCLINQVSQVCACESRCQCSHLLWINIQIEFDLLEMHREDLFATNLVWPIHQDLAVKPPCTKQCRVKDLWAVCGSQ